MYSENKQPKYVQLQDLFNILFLISDLFRSSLDYSNQKVRLYYSQTGYLLYKIPFLQLLFTSIIERLITFTHTDYISVITKG